jgi:hypothetical protein
VITPGIKVRLATETAMWGTKELISPAMMHPKVRLPQNVILPETVLSTVMTKARTVNVTTTNRNTAGRTAPPPNHGPDRRVHLGMPIVSSAL